MSRMRLPSSSRMLVRTLLAMKSATFSGMSTLSAAAFLRAEDYYGRAGWDAKLLLDNRSLPADTNPTPKKAPCAANSFWKGNRLFSPAGGGVSIMPLEALSARNRLDDQNGQLAAQRTEVRGKIPADGWWWD